MRVLLAIHNAYTDFTSGAAHSLRTMAEWLAEGGHAVRVLCTARFDGKPPASIQSHLAEVGAHYQVASPSRSFIRSLREAAGVRGGPTMEFTSGGIPVTMLVTEHNDVTRPDQVESYQFLFLFVAIASDFRPDVVLTCGPHPVLQLVMREARRQGILTVFTLRNYGYEHREQFDYVDAVLTASPYVSSHYARAIGLISTGIPSPIRWEDVLAPSDARTFLTFVNPALHKGAVVFARLADRLGAERPDIPVLVVQSAADAGRLNSIPGIDFSRYPQIMAAPPVPRPADFFALTRVLLMPSVFPEPFGRTAVEALINGIPPLVSDRGALPETVAGAGRVLPLPDWLTPQTTRLPDSEEIEPWFRAVCELWDDAAAYAAAGAAAREVAETRYSERVLRQQYLDYFTSLEPGRALFAGSQT